jgi:hypothetical protein
MSDQPGGVKSFLGGYFDNSNTEFLGLDKLWPYYTKRRCRRVQPNGYLGFCSCGRHNGPIAPSRGANTSIAPSQT